MSTLRDALKDYLDTRRALGFQLRTQSVNLNNFVTFLEHEGVVHITVDLALRWATQPRGAASAYQGARLADVRRFAAWRKATDPETEVPSSGLLPCRFRRKTPFIYSDAQVQDLLAAARALPSAKGLRGLTYATLFGLISVTGMRMSEAVAVDRDDVDLEEGIVTIRRTKFGKTRMVPLHHSTCVALGGYASARDHLFRGTTTPAFFLSERGRRVTIWSTEYNFAWTSRYAGLRGPVEGHRHGHGPRIHDLRHRFAVKTLIGWYRAGLDAEREMPKLSAYLGHVHVADTYWYIEAVPELLRLATERLERGGEEVRP
jgi:integrase/recombinase XerD